MMIWYIFHSNRTKLLFYRHLVVASLTVLVDIKNFLFDDLIATETVGIFNCKEDNHAHYE